MTRPLGPMAVLLFGSGACSLIYETVWLRELRLVFGASTMASAVVVACFVGGLGAGGLLFGKRADAATKPLAMYAKLEAGIALSAALTPLLLFVVRAAYVGMGGQRVLGSVGGTLVRLVLASLVFAAPTLLMGGTLPAIARAVERDEDLGRRDVAVLYGVNTLGAVTGCMVSTFILFETFGTRLSLWIAALVNLLIAVSARSLARSLPDVAPSAKEETKEAAKPASDPEAPAALVLGAAGVAGFVFCLMELVWYRMLSPLLGGTVFTFGLILALALLGIGLGGVAYGLRARGKAATTSGFAWTCLLEAAFVAIPYALGDRLAILAAVLRPLGGLSFVLTVAGWTLVTGIVVLPAAFVSGVQFPLLIGLLGRGNKDVGRDVGLTYATNTVGAIAGSLAGGFGLIPALSAPGCWRFVVWTLLVLGLSTIAFDLLKKQRAKGARASLGRSIAPALLAIVAWLCVRAEGPTAAWRHSPIGAGRVDAARLRNPNDAIAWAHARRHAIAWETDGRESSVALDRELGWSFIVNGKNDGSARVDAGTSVTAGMIGALLHPHPTRALVIGLGSGETAGWLGAIDSVTDVDVAELEPAILEVARRSAAINHDALANPKVHVEIGDARELLLTSPRAYDVVMSEPSNPYRAGVASLFTQSYYEAIRSRLGEDGVFLQWLQGYEVDAQTVRTVFATLASVFPEVQTWELSNADMLLVAAKKPIVLDIAQMRARLKVEPYKSGVGYPWRATELEGVLAHFVATGALARTVADSEAGAINTDDRNVVEFGFARSVGSGHVDFGIDDVRRFARAHDQFRPAIANGEVAWDRVDDHLVPFYVAESLAPNDYGSQEPARQHRLRALRAFGDGEPREVVAEWRAQPQEPRDPTELAVLAVAFAELGEEAEALKYAEALRAFSAGEADVVIASLRLRQGRFEEATAAFEAFFVGLRTDPWPMPRLVTMALKHVKQLADREPRAAPRLFAALREPFVLHLQDVTREDAALGVALHIHGDACAAALTPYEPNVPWNEPFLRARYECYRSLHDPRIAVAEEDLLTQMSLRPLRFESGLR